MGRQTVCEEIASDQMIVRHLLFVLILLSCSVVYAQQVKVSNQHVAATVESRSGLITLRVAPGAASDPQLTYPQKSFLTILYDEQRFTPGGQILTNNNVGVNIKGDARLFTILSNGATQKVEDTIRTTWRVLKGDLIQSVYPVDLGSHGQIVMRWSFTNNHNDEGLLFAIQYLLDLQIHQQDSGQDVNILTRYGYNRIWETFRPDTLNYRFGLPWFYATFDRRPAVPLPANRITGVGYTRDVNYKLGLKAPARMTIGDWGSPFSSSLVDNLWGVSPSAPWISTISDAAILFEWDSVFIAKGETVEVGSTSFGTGSIDMCEGEVLSGLHFPEHIVNKTGSLEPTPFEVNAFIFNEHLAEHATTRSMTLHVGPHLRIVSPDTTNIGQTIQRQLMEPTIGYIADSGAVTAAWKVVADMPHCEGTVQSWLKITSEGLGLGAGSDTCEYPITIDCDVPLAVNDLPAATPFEIIGNPAGERTLIRLRVKAAERVTLRMLDITGRALYSRPLGVLQAGMNDFMMSTNDLPVGMYYVVADFGGKHYVEKLIVK